MNSNSSIKANRDVGKCRHTKLLFDESLNTIECDLCHEKLNPIWVIKQFLRKDTMISQQLKYHRDLADKAVKKNRCKCEHCGKMTRIQKR